MGVAGSKLIPIREEDGVWLIRVHEETCHVVRFRLHQKNLIKVVVPAYFTVKYHKLVITSICVDCFGKTPQIVKFDPESKIQVLQARSFCIDTKITVPPYLKDFKANLHDFDTHNLTIPEKHKYLLKGPDGCVYKKYPFTMLAAMRTNHLHIRETCKVIEHRAIDDYTATPFISIPASLESFGLDNKTYGVERFVWKSPTSISILSLAPLMRISIKRLVLPEGIREIKCGTGSNTLEVIVFPKSLEIIDQDAFKGQTNLKQIYFRKGSELAVIHSGAFQNTSIQTVDFPAKLVAIECCAFKGTPLYRITFPEDSELRTIQQRAFQNTLLTSVTFPASVRSIDDHAFAFTDIERVVFLPESKLIKVHPKAFEHCTLLFDIIGPCCIQKELEPLVKAMPNNLINIKPITACE